MQKLDELTNRIAKLNPTKQALVEQFVRKLENNPQLNITLDQAIAEFEREHPELLRLLAQ